MADAIEDTAGIEFTGIWMKNLLSTGAVTQYIPLNADLLTLVLGLNTDSNGEETRNGAGKTTIVQALSFALYGQALDRIKVDNLINNINGKNMLVAVEFKKRADVFRIERGRKPTVLKFFKNDIDTDIAKKAVAGEQLGEMKDTQTEIIDEIGMDHTMFCHTLALNTNTIPFFKAPAAEQRSIIEKLMGVTQISEKAKALSKKVSDSKRAVDSEEAKIAAIVEANRRIQLEIDAADQKRAGWDRDLQNKIAAIAIELEAIDAKAVDFDAEVSIFDAIDAFIATETRYRDAKAAAERELALNERELKALEGELQTLLTLSQQDDPSGDIGSLTREITNLRDQFRREVDNTRDKAARDAANARDQVRREKARVIEAAQVSERKLLGTVDILTAQAKRLRDDKDRETALRGVKVTERYSADGTDCATCGQSLEGSDHLHTITTNLDEQITAIEASIKDIDWALSEVEVDITKNEREVDASRAAIEQAKLDLETFEADIDPVVDDTPPSVEDTPAILAKLEALEAAKAAAADLKAGLLAEHDAQSGKVLTLNVEGERLAKAIEFATHDLAQLGTRPTSTFGSRDEVYRARQAHEKRLAELLGDLERAEAAKNPYTEQVESFRNALQVVSHDDLEAAKRVLVHQDTLLKLLTQKDSYIRKRIIEQNLANLNERMAYYLNKLGLPHTVYFHSDMTVDITYMDRDYDYDQMSRGEKNRIIMSTSLAFRDVWEALNHTINLLWVDELLDNGLCASGSEAALGILKSAARQRGKNVFLISHKEELKGRVEKTMMVRKVNGFSEFQPDQF